MKTLTKLTTLSLNNFCPMIMTVQLLNVIWKKMSISMWTKILFTSLNSLMSYRSVLAKQQNSQKQLKQPKQPFSNEPKYPKQLKQLKKAKGLKQPKWQSSQKQLKQPKQLQQLKKPKVLKQPKCENRQTIVKIVKKQLDTQNSYVIQLKYPKLYSILYIEYIIIGCPF